MTRFATMYVRIAAFLCDPVAYAAIPKRSKTAQEASLHGRRGMITQDG